MKLKTLNLSNANYKENNFDFLRFFAASLVILYHSFPIHGDGDSSASNILDFLTRLPLPIFFIISGFLITKSWINNPHIITFFKKRILRIFPALIATVLFAIFLVGPITIGSLDGIRNYFSNPLTWQYAQNIVMRSRFFLPGIFEDNIFKGAINGSLWTLPVEFWLYISLSLVGYAKILERKRFVSILIVIVMYWLYHKLSLRSDTAMSFLSLPIYWTLKFGIYFYVGSFFYLFREKITFNIFVCLAALVILYNYPVDIVYYITLPYIVLYLALAINNRVTKNWGKYGDFSYGLYVYAFPVQQTIMHFGGRNMSLPLFFMSAYFATLLLAIISWNLIEKPALRLKKINITKLLLSRITRRNLFKKI